MSKPSQESSPITQWREKLDEALEPVFGCPAFPPKSMDIKELTKLQALARKAYITSATIELAQTLIGEDEQQVWDEDGEWCTKCEFQPSDDTRNCICVYRNELKGQLRQSLKELSE